MNFTRSVALTYARQGIRANSVSPGHVDTPLLARLPQATRDAILASDRASIVTGACFQADGGYTAI